MRKQSSFAEDGPKLYVVATPIGNLQELTPRAIEILKTVDVIAAEDTRHTKKICAHFGIQTPLIAHHAHNTQASLPGIEQLLTEGQSVALVSDAGYPLISDPGQELVARITEKGFPVIPVSGPSAFLDALVCSGLSVQPFMFNGFLAATKAEAGKQLNAIKELSCTQIFYVSVHRLKKDLTRCLEHLGDRSCCLVRELTKLHETFYRGMLSELVNDEELEERGEYVLLISGAQPIVKTIDNEQMILRYEYWIAQGLKKSAAIRAVAQEMQQPKNEVYRKILEQFEE